MDQAKTCIEMGVVCARRRAMTSAVTPKGKWSNRCLSASPMMRRPQSTSSKTSVHGRRGLSKRTPTTFRRRTPTATPTMSAPTRTMPCRTATNAKRVWSLASEPVQAFQLRSISDRVSPGLGREARVRVQMLLLHPGNAPAARQPAPYRRTVRAWLGRS